MKKVNRTILALAIASLSLPAIAQQEAPMSDIGVFDKEAAKQAWGERTYSPYVGRAFPTRVYWGDTHLHTALSADATIFGATLELEPAYRFARGEEGGTGVRSHKRKLLKAAVELAGKTTSPH